jgi:hypothetical protein
LGIINAAEDGRKLMPIINNLRNNQKLRISISVLSSLGFTLLIYFRTINLIKHPVTIKFLLAAAIFCGLDLIIDLILVQPLFSERYRNPFIWIKEKATSSSGKQAILSITIYSFLALALLSPFASNLSLPAAGDLPIHFDLTVQAGKALQEGQFPIRVVPDAFRGMRYADFQFYSQLPYTLSAFIFRRFFSDNPFIAIKFVIWLSLLLSALGMLKLSKEFCENYPASLLSGAIYMTSPYLLINIFSRGAFPEIVAQGLLPWVIYFSLRFYNNPKILLAGCASISWFLLAITHNITFFYSAFFIGIFFLALSIKKQAFVNLVKLGGVFIFGCLVAMYFLGPILKADYLVIRGEDFPTYAFSWYTHLSTLISPISMPPEPSLVHPTVIGLNPSIGWPLLFCVGFLIIHILSNPDNRDVKWKSYGGGILLIMFLFSFLLAWTPVDFWRFLPKIFRLMQFNYRLLTQVMWMGSVLSSIGLTVLYKNELNSRHIFLGLFIIGFSSSSFLISRDSVPQKISDLVKKSRIDITNDYFYDQKGLGTALFSGVNLPMLTYDNTLITNQDKYFENWSADEAPILVITGENQNPASIALAVLFNGKEIDRKDITHGNFSWTIDLQKQILKGSQFSIKFALVNNLNGENGKPDEQVKIKTLMFNGLSPAHTVIPFSRLLKKTTQFGVITQTKTEMDDSAGLVQLPVLYLPDFNKVLVNGKAVQYFPIPYGEFTLIGLQLNPGVYTIETSFVGLDWANGISFVTFFILMISLYLSIKIKIYHHQ